MTKKSKHPRARKTGPLCDYWVVTTRDGVYMSDVNRVGSCFNTWKFASYGAAVAYCRKYSLDPRDHIIKLVRFPQPVVLETREIDYGETSLSLAKPTGDR